MSKFDFAASRQRRKRLELIKSLANEADLILRKYRDGLISWERVLDLLNDCQDWYMTKAKYLTPEKEE